MDNKQTSLTVDISFKTIFLVIFTGLIISFLFLISDLFVNLFIAFIFMSALKPIVDFLEKKGMPRVLAASLTIILLVIFLIFFFTYSLPPLIIQTGDFFVYAYKQIVILLENSNLQVNAVELLPLKTLTEQIPTITNGLTKGVIAIFGNVMQFISLLFFTLYFLIGINKLDAFLIKILDEQKSKFIITTIKNVEIKLGSWVRGELILMFIIGLSSYIGLKILGINYALPLAMIAGLLEIFPIIGPIISAIPAFFVAGSTSFVMGFAVIALYILIQQLENNLIVPFVMKQSVGLSPLLILVSIFIGQRFLGTAGVILAVPILATISIVLQEIYIYFYKNNSQS